MRTGLFITVRLDSSRLKNKAEKKILDIPVLVHVINRAKLAKGFDEIIVCTTDRSVDDRIEEMVRECDVNIFRGGLKDKLERWLGAAQKYNIDYIVTFDGDDLFCDPMLLSMGVEQIKQDEYDFIEAPEGIICGAFTYAFRADALAKVCEIKNTDDTEMMWTYFKDSGLFKCGYLKNVDSIYFNDSYRLTLDYPEDFELFTKVFEHFDCKNNDIPLIDIIGYFKEHPEIPMINIARQQEFIDNQKKRTHLELKTNLKGV